jgi:hypothetical protein
MLPTDEGKKKVPLSVVAELSYQERLARPPADGPAVASPTERRTLRNYDVAKATIKIGEGGVNSTLPEQRRLIAATTRADASFLYSPEAPLTREELDLIDVPAGTHVLDRLLPGEPKQVGTKWKHDEETMRALMGLDTVDTCEVESVLIGVEQGHAKLRMAGTVYGKTDGAATELEVKAGYLFDTRIGRITRMNLAFAEKREEGRIGPAVDVVGKLTLEVDAAAPSQKLAEENPANLWASDPSGDALLLLTDEASGLRILHDRRWHLTSDEPERLVLRRIDDDEFIAQCNVTIRPERQEGRQSTIAEFERDVRFSLGERFESLVSSREWTNAAGLSCFRLVIHGKVDGVPIEWHYYLAAPPAGRSAVFAVSVEPRFVEQLREADQALVESLQLLPPTSGESVPAATSAGL